MTDLIGEIRKVDKIIRGVLASCDLSSPSRQGAVDRIEGEKCIWCGADLKHWEGVFHEDHAKDAICNWKERAVINILEEFACGYEPHNPSISDTSIQVRDYAYKIAKLFKEG